MNPATYLRVLGPEPWSVAYDEPSIRPDDSRYGENPNRLQRHTQFQVIVKPAPECAQELVVGSYQALGIDTCKNDIRFVEDNWESPALGAWGLGWEVWLNGMEVTQFTYFQQAGGITLDSVAVEITYGLERIIMALQGKSHFKDIIFSPGITYGDLFMQNEIEMSQYNMDQADIESNKQMFHLYESEALALLEKRLPVPAYNYVLKASHTFNILDARGAIGVTERARYFQRMRALSRDVAKLWVARREELEFPLLPKVDDQTSADPPVVENANVSSLDSVSNQKGTADFLLEIGVEELPAGDVPEIIAQVETLLGEALRESRLNFSSLSVDGTPRRAVAYVKDLQTRQADETKRVRGPPLRIAVKDGEMTKAALGFMRSQGVSQDSVELDEKEGYMYATVEQKGRCTEEVLSEMIPSNVLERINFGKSMRWNDTGVAFSRPLRWLLCLLDNHIVPVEYAGVRSGNTTRSLRGADGFATDMQVANAADYLNTLEELQIVLGREERRQRIRSKAQILSSEVGGIIPDEYVNGELVEEIVDLVENPIPLMGSFDEKFLDLPKEVLETVMKKHQRYLPVVQEDDSTRLMNKFITIVNGNKDQVDLDLIRQGNEAVLRARYSDAAFFYENDTQGKKLEDFIPDLSGLTFQEKLGSMLDKKNRVLQSIDSLATLFVLSNEDKQDAKSVANLFKADLSTSMVIEMTSLAGTIGRHYARKSGEVSPQVSEGIFDANLPRFSGDRIAQSRAGAVVAISDRMDSLVGLFSVGLIPKSTADPFALRRAALGVVQTLIANRLDVDVADLVRCAADTIVSSDNDVKTIDQQLCDSVLDFISKRLEGYLLDNAGFSDDIVKAALAVPRNRNSPLAALAVCKALDDALNSERSLVSGAQDAHARAARLLGSVKDLSMTDLMSQPVNENLLNCAEERNLWSVLSDAQTRFDLSNTSIEEEVLIRLRSLVDAKDSIDAFFDGVFVNAEDAEVRKNRLALCAKIVAVTYGYADLALLVNV